MATAAVTSIALRHWISQTDLRWLLDIPTTDLWWYTFIPVVLCFVAVNLFFRHIISIIWFSVKLLLAGVVYINIRNVIKTSLPDDPLYIESMVLGIQPGTIEFVSSQGMQVVVNRSLLVLATVCPTCFPPPTPPPPPPPTVSLHDGHWVNWIDNILAI